jgi:ELWxxDGT repeat protein
MDRSTHAHGGRRTGRILAAAAVGIACLVAATSARAQGTPYLVKDIDQRPNPNSVAVRGIGAAGDHVFFAGNDGEHGFELWTSDGTENGTRIVKDILPGPRGYVITGFTAVGDAIFFVTDDGVHGRELWTSDGSDSGTHLVRDVAPGRAESLPHLLTPLGDLLFFVADDGVHGDELWLTDGSEAGTTLVLDVRSGSGGARISEVVAAGGLVYFVANDGVHGAELWSSDGTLDGTVLVTDIRLGEKGSQPSDLVRVGDGVLFAADDGPTGRELWRADETSGAVPVADILPGRRGSEPSGLFAAGDRVYFTAIQSEVDGAQLFVSDGTFAGTSRISDVHGAWNGGITLGLTAAIGDVAYFVIHTDDGRGAALWRSDGTEDGTYLVKDIKGYPCSEEFRDMIALGDRLMLVARSAESDDELWTSDGTEAGTELVKDIFPGQPGGRPGSLAVAGGELFFAAIDGLHGRELWKSDGTENGTRLVRDILDGNMNGVASYSALSRAGDQVVFTATDQKVWSSDGTAGGTAPLALPSDVLQWSLYRLQDVPVLVGYGAGGAVGLWRPDGVTAAKAANLPTAPRFTFIRSFGDDLLYGVFDQNFDGGAMWRTVSGSPIPLLLKSFSRSYPAYPELVHGEAYFSAGDFATGSELWKTDGTPQGTKLVADVNPGPASAVFNGGVIGNVGGRILFAADDGVHGTEPFVTDGTPGGTKLLRDIFPGPEYSAPSVGGRLSGALYFGARDASGYELWRTDGTPSGTYRLKEINPGPDSSSPFGFVRVGDVLLFSAYEGATGRELWRTDGTADGTWMVADIQPGQLDGGITPIVVVGDVAYFIALMPNQATQLWVTDGTPGGTRLAADVSAAPSGGVRNLANRNGQLFFTADDGLHGNELWALTCGNGILDDAEECDDGAHNGEPTSCCSGACTVRPGTGDECDPVEGSLVVRRARVQYDAPGGATTGRLTVDGLLDADVALPLSLDAGLTAFVESGAGFSLPIAWLPAECRTQASGVLRCARDGAVATFRRVAGASPGAQRLRFALTVRGLDVAGPLPPSLGVKLRTGDRLDRAGSIADCIARRGALVCRP